MRNRYAAIAMAALGAAAFAAAAQQAATPAPSFAPSNLSRTGVRSLAANCAACHGTEGRAAAGSAVAGLAGRSKDELVQMMAQFKGGQRPATVMHQIAKGYNDEEVAAIADYFSRQSR